MQEKDIQSTVPERNETRSKGYSTMDKKADKSFVRGRAISMTSALASLPKPHGIRRSQSTLTGLNPRSVRVVVLGAGGVGKTAMSVRFVTKRFIGDYDPTLETIYRHATVVDNQLVNFEIMDTAGQENNSLLLEDKCKWGESFIFVYDVTDKYSFDEVTRLKFIASYTHSKARANFSPCWALVGNKSDLSERDRMVSTEEGVALAWDLGCHVFHEISVKESLNDSSEVFEDLWREFSRLSPRSPSSRHRRKNSYKIQDKISTLNSNACMCAAEALKQGVHKCCKSSDVVSSFKRQTSTPILQLAGSRQIRSFSFSDATTKEEQFDATRSISCIPENAEEHSEEEEDEPPSPLNFISRSRTNAITGESKSSFTPFSRKKTLSKAMSVDNVFASVDPGSPTEAVASFMISSTSSSNSSLNGSISPVAYSGGLRRKTFENLRTKSGPQFSTESANSDSSQADDMVSLYRDHCKRTRARRHPSSKFNRSLSINDYKTS